MTEQNIIKKAVHLGQILEFEVAFPGETPLCPREYLKGSNLSTVLNVAAYFLGFKSFNSEFDDNKKLLEAIFSQENQEFANNVYKEVKAEEEKVGSTIQIINAYSSLKLFEYFFGKEEEAETQTSIEFEINVFKAYLAINSEFTKTQKAAFTSTEDLESDLKIAMMLFCMHYPIFDKVDYDIHFIWATQAIKAIYLFEFLETHGKTKLLLEAFLKHFNSNTWQDYLKSLIPLTLPAIQNKKEGHIDITVNVDDKFKETVAFLEKLKVGEEEDLLDDFISVRTKPFYKVKDGVYRVIFNLFVVEKIFKGVYFLLRDVNDKLPENQKVAGLKSIYTYEFSEKTLLYKTLQMIYPDKAIKYSGQELADKKIKGAPDYYIRKGKNIMLFESKDFLIRADRKASFDFNIYDEEFGKTLYYEELDNGKQKAGAVMQLIYSIKKILKKEFSCDKDYHYKDIFIYPILITHDFQYDTPGFNYLVNHWFKEELQTLQEGGLFIRHVKPLIVVNIDSLIYHQVGLSGNVQLHEVLKLYSEHNKMYSKLKFNSIEDYQDYRMSKLAPFSLFIDKYFNKKGFTKVPPILDVISPALFKEQLERESPNVE